MSEQQAKQDALEKIKTLAQAHGISTDEIGATLTESALKDKSGKWLVQLLGYLGGAFIFGGLGLLINMIWDDLDSASRVIITFGPGLTAYILAIITLSDKRFQKASTPLFLKAAILQPFGMFVFLREYSNGGDPQLAAMVIFGLLAIQFLSTFYAKNRTSLLFFGYLFFNGSVGILMDRAGIPGDILGIALGFSIMTVAWTIDKTQHRAIAPFWYFIGSTGLLWSVFEMIEGSALDITFLPLAIIMMLLSVRIKSRTLLIVSTFSLIGFLGYYTEEYFSDMVGWPVALMIMGVLLIATSAYALKLGQKIKMLRE